SDSRRQRTPAGLGARRYEAIGQEPPADLQAPRGQVDLGVRDLAGRILGEGPDPLVAGEGPHQVGGAAERVGPDRIRPPAPAAPTTGAAPAPRPGRPSRP